MQGWGKGAEGVGQALNGESRGAPAGCVGVEGSARRSPGESAGTARQHLGSGTPGSLLEKTARNSSASL